VRSLVPLFCSLLSASLVSAAPTAYVALCCATPATISVLDPSTGLAVAQFPSAVGAAAMAPAPDYRAIYVLTQQYNGVPGEPWGLQPGGVNSVVILDLPGGSPSAVIPLTAMPFAIAFSPDGSIAYVIAVDSSFGSHLILIDTQSRRVVRDKAYPSSKFGPGVQIVPSADGSQIYLQIYAGEAIWKIDAQTLAITQSLTCSPYCQGLALVENDTTLLTVEGAATVDYLDAASLQPTGQIPWPLPPGVYAGWVIPVSPDGSTAYFGSNVLSAPSGSVAALDIASGLFSPVLTGMGIDYTAAISPDGAWLATDSFPATLGVLGLQPMAAQAENVATLSQIGAAFFLPHGDRLFVLNQESSYLARIDVASGSVTGRIPVGSAPIAIAAESAHHRLFVANQASNTLSVINTTSSKTIVNYNLLSTGWSAHAVAAAGAHIFIASRETLQMLDLTSGVVQQLYVPNAGLYPLYRGLAASPDGQSLYFAFTTQTRQGAASGVLAGLDVYDTHAGALAAQIAIPEPQQIAFSPDSSLAYVGSLNAGSMQLAVIDTHSRTVISTIPIPQVQQVASLAISPDGRTLHVLDALGAAVTAVDLASGSTGAGTSVPANPTSLAVSPDGALVYVTHSRNPQLTVINTATGSVTGTIGVGTGSNAVVFVAAP